MAKKIKNIEECARLIEIQVPRDTVKDKFAEVYKRIQKNAKVPGFRSGKVPVDILKKHYAEHAKEEVLRDLVPEYCQVTIDENNLDVLGNPQITDIKIEGEGDLNFTAKVNLRPSVKLKNYKGIKLIRRKPKVGDEEVNSVLKSLQEQNAKYETVQGRPVKKGDYILCDFKGMIGDKVLGQEHKNAWLCVDDNSMMPGLADNISGMDQGEEKDIMITLPKDYPDKNYAGREATFHVRVGEIKDRKISEINDEFARNLGNYKDVAELKEKVREETLKVEDMRIKHELEGQIIQELLKANSFSLPSSLIESQLEGLVEKAKQDLAARGIKKEEIEKEEAALKKRLRSQAEQQVRTYFIIQKIAIEEGIKVNKEEVDARVAGLAKQYGKTQKELTDHLDEKNLLNSLLVQIQDEKVMELLLKEADIKDGK